jgi:hypothetical protein
MALKKPDNWHKDETAPGVSVQAGKKRGDSGNAPAKKRKPAANDPDPKSVRFTPAEDADGNHIGYVSETEYDNSNSSYGGSSEGSSYKPPTTSIHADQDSAADHLAKTFGQIESDETLDPAEKRRSKAKAAMQVGKA